MSKNWELTISNIGGFRGNYNFILKPGLNILGAPNATGKTSFINAIRLLATEKDENELNIFLNSSCMNGEISLKNEDEYFIKLSRGESKIKILDRKLIATGTKIDEIAFLTNDNPFISSIEKGLDLEVIYDWLKNITDLEYYDKAFSIVTGIGSSYQIELEKIKSTMKIKESELEIQLTELTNSKTRFEKRLNSLRKKGKSDSDIENTRVKHTNIAHEIDILRNRIKRFEADFEQAEKTISEIKAAHKRVSEDLERVLKQFVNAEAEIKKREKLIEKTEEQVIKLKEEKQSLINNLSRLDTIKSEISQSLESKEKKCAYCNSNIDLKSYQNHFEKIIQEVDNLQNDLVKLENRIRKLEAKRIRISNEIQDFKINLPKRKRHLDNELSNLDNQISRLEEIINTYPEQILTKEKKLQDKEVLYNDIQTKLIDLTSNGTDNKKMQNDLVQKLQVVNQKIADVRLQSYKMKFSNQKMSNLVRLIDATKEIGKLIQEKIAHIQDELIDKINERIIECYEGLKFLDFSSITLTDDLKLIIKRKPGIITSFKELSTMERTLVGIIISFSVLKAFYPDFPIFAIDDPLNAADDIRFQKLVKYLSGKIPLLIVTRNLANRESDFKILSQDNIFVEI